MAISTAPKMMAYRYPRYLSAMRPQNRCSVDGCSISAVDEAGLSVSFEQGLTKNKVRGIPCKTPHFGKKGI